MVFFTLICSSICFAADGNDLNKQQTVAEKFIGAFNINGTDYTEVIKGFDNTLKNKINEKVYNQLQKHVKEKFGDLKDNKFYSYQRFDEVDYVTYITSFSKEKLVSITLSFKKNGKMVDFSLRPIQRNDEKRTKK